MKLMTKGEHRFWKFESLSCQNITHASFQKHGDLSQNAVQSALQLPNLAWAKQIHSSNILEIREPGCAGEGDILITNCKSIALIIQHADCQAALFYDPVSHAAAAVHCGWRGSTQKIYTKTIAFMQNRYGCHPKNIIACISPSLGPNASQFINYKQELPSSFLSYQFKPSYFDFWKISKDELMSNGILQSHIEIAEICTYSNPSDYYSYRFNKTKDRQISIISLL